MLLVRTTTNFLTVYNVWQNVARQKDKKNIHRMPERCRILVPVSKGNWGNQKKLKQCFPRLSLNMVACRMSPGFGVAVGCKFS
jgi:hypothetical protein